MAAADIYKAAGFAARTSITSVRDVSAAEFITAFAAHLEKKKGMEFPEFAKYIKTATGREMPPTERNWYWVRAASIARKVYLNHGIGVGALANWYGKVQTRGSKPQHHHVAHKKLIRSILAQFKKLGWVAEIDERGGNEITAEGMKIMDTIARQAILTA